MEFAKLKELLKQASDDNYEAYIKSIISIEKNINDNKTLYKLYTAYMNDDVFPLLNDKFNEKIEEFSKEDST